MPIAISRRTVQILFGTILSIGVALPAHAVIADADIQKILAERIDVAKKSIGIVVGVIDDNGTRVVSHGHTAADKGQAVDGNTLFEIGSITKVFTSLILADMIERGEVALDDPISKYLPEGTKAPERGGKAITLRHLATHTSGLPRLPNNFSPKDPNNPYVDYDAARMLAFLGFYTLTRDPGERYEYSNYGAGLLGYVLARRAGTDYATLVKTRILQPLEMNDTAIVLPPALRARFAVGHDASGKPVSYWDLDGLVAAGGLRSTANDMLKFLAAQMGRKKTPLSAAMARSQQALHDIGGPERQIGMGWHINWTFATRIVWHNGGTGGFVSFAGFTARDGVVVLSNQQNGVDDIGYHLLDSRNTLAKFEAPRQRTAVQLDAATLDAHAGQYQLAPDFIISFMREGDKFMTQATRQPKFEVFAESETEFFLRVVDAQITFVRNAYGKTTHIVLHQGGRDLEGKRISDQPVVVDKAMARRTLAPMALAKFADELEKRGYADARQVYDEMTMVPDFKFPESTVNSWGISLLRDFRKDAVEILKLNMALNPLSANAHDSLALAYRLSGENAMSLKHYRRALELDPGLAGATRVIAALQRKAIKLDPKAFDAYAGEYEIAPNVNITVRREGDKYTGQVTRQDAFEFFAESDGVFFATTVLLQITFFKDESGKVTHLVISQGGRETKATKLF